jgi:predicted acetyltransferase
MGPKSNALLTVGGEPRGYALYRVKAEWGDRGPKNTLNVLEVTALDPAAETALWEWLVGIDLVSQVKAWRTPPVHNPLLLQVVEPQRLGLTIRDGLWLRLVDLKAALEARTYAGPGRLTLDVSDAFLPSNAGRWTLDATGSGGTGSLVPAAEGVAADIALDIADLATVYLGAFTFADLVRAGRARECRDGAASAADALFSVAVAPWSSTMF